MIENNTSSNTGDTNADNNIDIQTVQVGAGGLSLEGLLRLPTSAHGIVLLAQGSRHVETISYSSSIAEALNGSGMATLTVHLLTENEETLDNDTQFFRYNISILSQRIIGIANWIIETPTVQNLAVGYFGTGASGAAALQAAAERPDVVHAVVAANARLDLVQEYLARIPAPVMLIAGENDPNDVNANREALSYIHASIEANKRLETIAGASAGTMFDTPESLNKVLELAGQWFSRHLEPIV